MIRMNDACFSFGGRPILNHLTLSVGEGEVVALLGRNGEGKTTLMRLLIGLLPIRSGTARVLGLDPAVDFIKIRRQVGYAAPDRMEAPPWMRVFEYLQFIAPFYPSWDERFAVETLALLKLDPGAKINELSKGGKVRLSVAAALAHRPSLLLLDEPFAGLDPVVRRELMEFLIQQLEGRSRSILLISHSIEDVERLADRVAILENGSIAWSGTLDAARERLQQKRQNNHAAAGGFDLGELLMNDTTMHTISTGEKY